MADKLILQIHVSIRGEDKTEFFGPTGGVIFIPFSGTAEGEIFHGAVRPGAVDCQRVNAAGVKHMCAKYVLEGKDKAGKPCCIFIENNGWYAGEVPDGFATVPTLFTDSEVLAPYLHRAAFRGKGERCPGGVTISIYEIEGA